MYYYEGTFDFVASSEDIADRLVDFDPSERRHNRLYFVIKKQNKDEVRKAKVELINQLKAVDPGGKVEDLDIIIETKEASYKFY